ncbi:MAG: hypothetical protein WC175_03460 [Candidatus Dojkabacteria bacterium]
MPNYCTNIVDIVGSKKDIQEIWDKYRIQDEGLLDEPCLSFNKILPRPEELKDSCGWSIENWGTKWDICSCYNSEIYLSYPESSMNFNYDTAWGPGDKVLLYLSKLYPEIEITLEYYEMGCMFAGKTKFKAGEVIDDFYTEDYDKLKAMYPDEFYLEDEEQVNN